MQTKWGGALLNTTGNNKFISVLGTIIIISSKENKNSKTDEKKHTLKPHILPPLCDRFSEKILFQKENPNKISY